MVASVREKPLMTRDGLLLLTPPPDGLGLLTSRDDGVLINNRTEKSVASMSKSSSSESDLEESPTRRRFYVLSEGAVPTRRESDASLDQSHVLSFKG